jgi:Tfp pilus assembly protein PilF
MVTGAKWKRLNSPAPNAEKKAFKINDCWKHATLCCLEKDSAKRPRTVDSVITLLNTPPPRKWPAYTAAVIMLSLLTVLAIWKLRPHHIHPEAQAAVDQARTAMKNVSREGFEAAITNYKKARDIEPAWALPRAELAYTYAAASNAGYFNPANALIEAHKEALEAIRLDPSLAKAHGALAWAQSLRFDEWPKAEEIFLKALQLDPNDGQIHYWFGVHLRKKHKFREAEEQDKLALRLTHFADPNIGSELSFLYWTWGQTSKMHKQIQEQLGVFRNDSLSRFLNARLLKLEGHYKEAEQELLFAEQLGFPSLTVMAERISVEEYEGNLAGARRDIDYLSKTGIDGVLLAGDYIGLHDYDAAFNVLEAAYRRKDNTLLSLDTSPVLAPLHGDPRFESLRRRLHFVN